MKHRSMVSRGTRAFERRVAALDAAKKAQTLEAKGVTDSMWDMLQDLHLARLKPERAIRIAAGNATLAALKRRGLATSASAEDQSAVMAKATPEGAAMVKKGRPS